MIAKRNSYYDTDSLSSCYFRLHQEWKQQPLFLRLGHFQNLMTEMLFYQYGPDPLTYTSFAYNLFVTSLAWTTIRVFQESDLFINSK